MTEKHEEKKEKELDPTEVVAARMFLARENAAVAMEDQASDLRSRAATCKLAGGERCDPHASATADALVAEAARLRRVDGGLSGLGDQVGPDRDALTGVDDDMGTAEQLGAVTRTTTETVRVTEDRASKAQPKRRAHGK